MLFLFSCSVMSDCLQLHRLQHARISCPSLSLRVCSNPCPLNQWCHATISSCHPLLPLGSIFPSIRVFSSELALHIGGQSSGASALASVLSMNIQGWFPLGLAGLISLLSKGLSRVCCNTTVQKHQAFGTHLSLWSNSHIHACDVHAWMHIRKTHSCDYTDLCGQSNVSAF